MCDGRKNNIASIFLFSDFLKKRDSVSLTMIKRYMLYGTAAICKKIKQIKGIFHFEGLCLISWVADTGCYYKRIWR